MTGIPKSDKLVNVCYDIRGPVLHEAYRREREGHRIAKLNIGNPAAFGFVTPREVLEEVSSNLGNAQGYCDPRGLLVARQAVADHCRLQGIDGIHVDDVYLGNGVSELIVMAMQALLNDGDTVLIPAPDYPLWTAAVTLSGGTAVHYVCDEDSGWLPDLEDLERKITSKTRGLVLINPNNPTGAVYPRSVLERIVALARDHKLIIFADEIYSKIVYDDAKHYAVGALADDVLVVSFDGLSKAYRLAGFRCGWMVVSGAKLRARGYIEGLHMLASMRLCANVPAQYAVAVALRDHQRLDDLVLPGGRLREQRDVAWRRLNEIEGVSCTKPQGAIYCFPRLDRNVYDIHDDEQLILDLLIQENVLLVHGGAFNWHRPDHFRIVFLPAVDELEAVIGKVAAFLSRNRVTTQLQS